MSQEAVDLVGQGMLLRPDGTAVSPPLLDALARVRPGGVILFAGNIVSPSQLHEFVGSLQHHAATLGLPPLLVAIDQEGGIVSRLPEPWLTVPSQMAQGATGDPAAARSCAAITGRQLRARGITVNLAPVLDVNSDPRNPVIGTRAFGDDPALAARFGVAAVEGYREAGVIATAKHFPGHGDTAVDSHIGLPVVRKDRDQLDAVELAPFAAAIAAGIPAIMTSHILFPALDDAQPATLTRRILTDLLRGEMGFAGAIMTDALEMRAIAQRFGLTESACLAKAAGADLVMPLGSLDEQLEVAAALEDATRRGEIVAEEVVATARRLEELRRAFSLTHELPPLSPLDPSLADEILAVALGGVTVRDPESLLPLARETQLALIDCSQARWSAVEEVEVATARTDVLRGRLVSAFPRATALTVPADPSSDLVAEAKGLAERSDVVLFVTRDAFGKEGPVRIGQALASSGKPIIHAAVRGPYDAADFPDAAATVLTYGDPPVSIQALVTILAGTATQG